VDGKRLLVYAQVVLDKQNGILSLLRVSGMRSAAFWLATLISDLMLFFGVVSLVLGMGLAFGHPPFIKVPTNCFMNLVENFQQGCFLQTFQHSLECLFSTCCDLSKLGFSYFSSRGKIGLRF
jgi:hypothetical protein